jgi:hypothetical protein
MRAIRWLAAVLVATAQGAPVVSTVDTAGTVGWYPSIQLDAGVPVVSYQDETNRRLKLARCVAGCGTPAASWITSVVDQDGDVGWYTSLQLQAGRPAIAYYDVKNGALKLATCIAQCASASPQWSVTTVDDSSVDTGRFPTLAFIGGKPVIAYRDKSRGRLMFAACTAACETTSPTWIVTVVDGAGDLGRFAHMSLVGERPVMAYLDFGSGDIKVATCVAACTEAQPSWAIKVVDRVANPDIEMQFSIDVDAGKPWISYFNYGDSRQGTLRMATCTAGCDSALPTWVASDVDGVGFAGLHSSIRVKNGRPVIAYYGVLMVVNETAPGHGFLEDAEDVRLAACLGGCDTPSPRWAITTVDNQSLAGWYPSLVLDGDRAIVAYHDMVGGDLKVAWVDMAGAALPVNHTGLWWDFEESGWGVNFAHQGDVLFATLFVYDASGAPMWLVMSGGAKQSGDVFSGELYRTTGPAFDANPFAPLTLANVTRVGTMTARFAGDTAELSYSVNGRAVAKRIKKQVFGAAAADCHPVAGDRGALANHQVLWWNPAESGWGINVTQQGDIVFATLFTYGRDGQGLWLVMPAGARQPDASFAGDLYRTAGHPFDQIPFPPLGAEDITRVGAMRLGFTDGTHGQLTYTFDGATVMKSIERQVFSAPAPACSG